MYKVDDTAVTTVKIQPES